MSEDWILLGFDARVAISCEMRKSVDTGVWPSVFDAAHPGRPAWTGPVQQLWDDSERLKAALTDPTLPPGIRIIAIALLRSYGDEEVRWRGRLGKIQPERVADEWASLGLDVADEYLESAIAMPTPMANVLSLNKWSLFDDLSEAMKFVELVNQIYPQQSPFCIYGIWEVK